MSFNPFDPIRKYQKSFLAAACILCMFVFIFSFGQGDLFQTLLGKMGNENSGTYVATIGGQKITTGDLDRIRRLRERANEFMVRACSFQFATLEGEDRERANQKNPAPESPELVERRQTLYLFAQFAQNPGPFGGSYFASNLVSNEENLDWLVWQKEADRLGIQVSVRDLALLFNKETATPEWWTPGKPITTISNMDRFFQERFAVKDMGPEELVSTLCQEFRVLFAKQAILGPSAGLRFYRDDDNRRNSANAGKFVTNPMAPTPSEFQEFYAKQRTTVNALFLPVEASTFLPGQSAEKPSDDNLKALFELGKDRDQDASLDRPGFKTPRRVQVAYVTSTYDKPWYKTALARVQAQRVLAPMLANAGLGGPAFSLGSLWSLADNNDPVTGNLGALGWMNPFLDNTQRDQLVGAYEQKLRTSRLRGGLLESWMTAPIDQVHGIHAVKPIPIATWYLARVSPAPGIASVVAADTLWKASAARTEARERAALIAASRLVGLTPLQPAGGFLPVFASMGSVLPTIPKSFEESNITAQMLPELVSLSARQDFESTWKRLKTAIAAFKGKTDKSEAETFIAGEVKRLGLTYKAMATPRDLYDLPKDPALASFRSAHEGKVLNSVNPVPFSFKFFMTQGTYDPEGWATNVDDTARFSTENWIQSNEPYLYWRTDDLRAQARTFEQARADVEKYWYTEKYAVSAARDKAQEIAREANAMVQPEDKTKVDAKKKYWAVSYRDILPEAVTFLSGQKLAGKPSAPFEVENICRLIPQKTTNPFQPKRYDPFRFSPAQIPFPRQNFLDQVLALKQPGQATVLRDAPGNVFYVVILLSRNEPSPFEFQQAFEKAGADFDRDDLWVRFYSENQFKFDNAAMKMLRSANSETKLDDDGRFILPAALDRKRENPDF